MNMALAGVPIALYLHNFPSRFKLLIMQRTFSIPDMTRWVDNFRGHDDLPFITTSALIQLSDLEMFIANAKAQGADSIRVYFLRFGMEDAPTDKVIKNGVLAEGCKWRNASPTLTQGTIAMVPAKNFTMDEHLIFSADDIRTDNQVTVLLPGIIGKGTGLNPPSGQGIAFDLPTQ